MYRVYRKAFADEAFSGAGARAFGGRWNSKGTAIIYTASALSLSLLEIVATTNRRDLPSDYVYATVTIPDGVVVETLNHKTLPQRWYATPAPRSLQEIGDTWIRKGSCVALAVPSAIVRIEENVLLNPSHRDFARLKMSRAEPLPLDTRLS